ncbi:MAG TPA: nuclear transport factor 2 family protein [Xanthomonadales bacterium]|nr:nuclear transport factor 2 family protein [Xanthomonadales bacterium]
MYGLLKQKVALLTLVVCLLPCVSFADSTSLMEQVRDSEAAFARSMADRDFQAFRKFIDDEAVFYSQGQPLEGRQAVENAWKPFYEDEEAPFSWEPGTVAVLESGSLALSSGPVFNAAGEQVAIFTSVWRKNEKGRWLVVFDKGNRYCPETVPDDGEQD